MDENSICIIAENIDRIAKKQFYNQKFIKQVVIPESVHYIEAWAFAYCTSLSLVELPGKCNISLDAFVGCEKLKQIVIKDLGDADGQAGTLNKTADSSYLLALLFMKFPEYSIYDISDVGSISWLERIDYRIRKEIESPPDDGFCPFPAGGEEDYEGPENDLDYYIDTQNRERCRLIFERILIGNDKEWQWQYLRACDVTFDVVVAEVTRQNEYYSVFRRLNLITDDTIEQLLRKCIHEPELASKLLADKTKNMSVDVFDTFKL